MTHLRLLYLIYCIACIVAGYFLPDLIWTLT
jgi:hypothetical protein